MHRRWNRQYIIFYFLIFFSATLPCKAGSFCNPVDNPVISPGVWRGELMRNDGNPIVFNFEIRERFGRIIMFVINGSERLLVDNIRQSGDSVFIEMPFFDSHFVLRILDSQRLEGSWIKNSGNRHSVIAFTALYNHTERFPVTRAPDFNISGRWSVHFKSLLDSTESVGEFKQYGAQVSGTFLTPTGDYRFLQGVVTGDTLKLSAFDGGHAYSFVSRILDTNTMTDGFYYAGATSVEKWFAEKNENAKLPDEFSQTRLKDSANAMLHFTFRDLNGTPVSLSHARFKNKVVVIQILGSWCPNCMDETKFLAPWYLNNKYRGVEVVGLAYERTASYADAKRLLQPFITRFHVTYPILPTGVTVNDSLRTEKTLPEIQQIMGFPTTIFIDKKGMIRKIHTGFNGPGTGEHYILFQKEFNELIDRLLKE
jgi:thiol-disulfide isomerase/thioredoxin